MEDVFDFLHERIIHYESEMFRTYYELRILSKATDEQLATINRLANQQFCMPVYIIYRPVTWKGKLRAGETEKTLPPDTQGRVFPPPKDWEAELRELSQKYKHSVTVTLNEGKADEHKAVFPLNDPDLVGGRKRKTQAKLET